MSKQTYEEEFAAIYQEAYGGEPTKAEVANFMDEALELFEWYQDEFEEANGYPARSKEELFGWLDAQMPVDGVTVH